VKRKGRRVRRRTRGARGYFFSEQARALKALRSSSVSLVEFHRQHGPCRVPFFRMAQGSGLLTWCGSKLRTWKQGGPPIDREVCLRHVPYETRLRQSARLQGHRFSTASGVLRLWRHGSRGRVIAAIGSHQTGGCGWKRYVLNGGTSRLASLRPRERGRCRHSATALSRIGNDFWAEARGCLRESLREELREPR
jgi:hypothetical protein